MGGYGTVEVNTLEITEAPEHTFEPSDITEVICNDCGHDFEVEAYVAYKGWRFELQQE